MHEGPARISKLGTAPLKRGMILSNEPGYYKTGAYGIRIENLVLVIEGPQVAGAEKPLNAFETLTLAPIDRRLVARDLLTADEVAWLDAYHARVRATLAPLVDAETRSLARRGDGSAVSSCASEPQHKSAGLCNIARTVSLRLTEAINGDRRRRDEASHRIGLAVADFVARSGARTPRSAALERDAARCTSSKSEAPMSCCDEPTALVPDTDVSRRAPAEGRLGHRRASRRCGRPPRTGPAIKLAFCSQLLCVVPYEVARAGGHFKKPRARRGAGLHARRQRRDAGAGRRRRRLRRDRARRRDPGLSPRAPTSAASPPPAGCRCSRS